MKIRSTLITVLLSAIVATTTAVACTNITLKAKDDSVVIGRTLEFGPDLHSNIITSPRDKKFSTPAPDGQPGKEWYAKYGYIFLDFFGSGRAIDGMNEKGLSFGGLYLPGYAEYQKVPNGQDKNALSYIYFGDWILSNFSSVEEVKQALKTLYVYAKPANFGPYKNMIFPLHFIVSDTSGKSIVIEFIKHKMKVYDSKKGILTNSPTFNWQRTNLKNYANLSAYSVKPIQVDGIEYSGTGQGSGAVGLPGDFSPPSRFVKMAFLVQNSFPTNNAKEALNLAQHIINDVDIPNGTVRGIKGTNDPTDKTQWTVFKDLTHRILYFKSYENTNLKLIDLDKINFAKGASQLKMPVSSSQVIEDVSDKYSR